LIIRHFASLLCSRSSGIHFARFGRMGKGEFGLILMLPNSGHNDILLMFFDIRRPRMTGQNIFQCQGTP
jgi:hypothetical protein